MRKVWIGLTSVFGIVCIGITAAMEYLMRKKQVAMSVSVIGSADGPTSIFLAGTVGDIRPLQIGLAVAGTLSLLISLGLYIKNRRF